jgi:hypothetical protein
MFKQELSPMSPVKLTSELRVSDNCDYPFIEEFKRWSKIEKAKLRRKLNMRNKPISRKQFENSGSRSMSYNAWRAIRLDENAKITQAFEKLWEDHVRKHYPLTYLHEREKEIWAKKQREGTRLKSQLFPYTHLSPTEDMGYAYILVESAVIFDPSI